MRLRTLMLSGFFTVAGPALVASAKEPPKMAAKPEMPRTEIPRMAAITATAELKGADGKSVGTAMLEETPHGVLITADLMNLAPGEHAFHIHETGKCEAPFKTAGGHFNPEGHKHGIKAEAGNHAGDLPDIFVAADGKAHFQALAAGVTLKKGEKTSLADADGSALVVHKSNDDMMTDPTGNAGDRVACGVIEEKGMMGGGTPAPPPAPMKK